MSIRSLLPSHAIAGTPRTSISAAPVDAGLPFDPNKAGSSPQMVALGGLIIIGVLVGSYTTRYDAAITHVGGPLAVPSVGFLALQLYLARAAFRLFTDIHMFAGFGDYMRARLLRYMPALVPAVLLGLVVAKTVGLPGVHVSATDLPANLLMMADVFGVEKVDQSHWRVKIEIMQALLLGFLWFGPVRKHLALVLTIGLAYSACFLSGEPARQNILTLHGLITCDGYLPLFVFGLALRQVLLERSSVLWWLMLVTSGLLASVANMAGHGPVLLAALACLVLVSMERLPVLGRVRPLILLGEIAYPIYVVHFVNGFAIIRALETNGLSPLAAILVASAVAIALGKLFNIVFERPAERHGVALISALIHLPANGVAYLARATGLHGAGLALAAYEPGERIATAFDRKRDLLAPFPEMAAADLSTSALV